jgi:ATP-dependent DNA helicase RecG
MRRPRRRCGNILRLVSFRIHWRLGRLCSSHRISRSRSADTHWSSSDKGEGGGVFAAGIGVTMCEEAVATFVRRAREERQFPVSVGAALDDVMTHLNLFAAGQPTNATILLFGRDPQRFLANAEVRCMHFHGTEIVRPVPFYRIFKGNLFEQVDQVVHFVLSKVDRSVGTRAEGRQAPVRSELPREVIADAIVNAAVHRGSASATAVQVSVFADRVEVWNPGELPQPLTPERLRHPHSSIPRNHRICEALFLARYIEKFGTATLMMIRESVAHGLSEPDFEQRAGEFVTTVWHDWLTEKVLTTCDLNDRQRKGITHLKTIGSITSREYQVITGAPPRTTTQPNRAAIVPNVQTARARHRPARRTTAKSATNRPIRPRRRPAK